MSDTSSEDAHRREQVPTRAVSAEYIMRHAAFARGVAEKRNGRPPDYDANDDWEYERGRLWASIAPLSMPLKIGGRLNPKAVALYKGARKRNFIPGPPLQR